jgi:exosortase
VRSVLPFVNYLVWVSARVFVDPLADERAVSTRDVAKEFLTRDDIARESNPSAEIATHTWFALLSLSILVLVMYGSVLRSLARQWWTDPNYGHGFFVLVFAGYVLWSERSRWLTTPFRPSNFGFAILVFAIGLRVLGMLAGELFIGRLSLVILISGMVLFLAGRPTLRSMAFPIGYLLFMIPLPGIVYFQLTFPLQLWASRMAASGLVALGIHTVREGNLLMLPNCTLNVVEACSGIRSLLSLLAAAVAYGYLAEPRIWKRLALAVVSIPIAIASNGLRLVATGVLSYFYGPRVDSGAVHLALGLGFFALAFLSILLVHRLLGLRSTGQNPAPVTS